MPAGALLGLVLARQFATHAVRLGPLVLVLVQLLQLQQRVLVARVQPQHFAERFVRAVDEAAAREVQAQAEQGIGVFELADARPLQDLLVDLDGAPDVALLAIQVAENHVDLDGILVDPRGLAQLLDRVIELVGDEEVQALDVVRRLPRLAAIDPAAFVQLVALPRLAGGQAEQEGDERGEQGEVVGYHGRS